MLLSNKYDRIWYIYSVISAVSIIFERISIQLDNGIYFSLWRVESDQKKVRKTLTNKQESSESEKTDLSQNKKSQGSRQEKAKRLVYANI